MSEVLKKLSDGRILLEINKETYNMDTVLKTSYKFTDRCYIHADIISENKIGVYFKAKNNEVIEKVIDDFCNELIDQQVRFKIEGEYGSIRDLIIKKAFSPIDSPPS